MKCKLCGSVLRKIETGIYQPKATMQGWTLEEMNTDNVNPPILNDNLFNVIIEEINKFKNNREIYEKLNFEFKRGILLYGSPGNGKTSFIKSVLKEINAISIIVKDINDDDELDYVYSIIEDKTSQDTFKILVMEDIDAMHESDRSDFLNFMDGVRPVNNTLFIATTNFPENLDVAIKERPSRFDSIYKLGYPNTKVRKQLLKKFFPEVNARDIEEGAKISAGFSGAYFKEFYLFSKINDISMLNSIKEIKRRKEKLW